MKIQKKWEHYANETDFNLSVLPTEIVSQGKEVSFRPKQFIVSRGDPLEYIYFLKSGSAMGTRNYADGNKYNYFQVDCSNGNLGILELFARESEYIATIICVTEVSAVRISAGVIFDYVMENTEMLRRCLTLVAKDLYRRSASEGKFYYLDGINRVRYYLVDYYNEHSKEGNGKVIVRAEYQDIASGVGISIRTVGRSIRKLKDEKEIISKDKKIIIDQEHYELLLESLDF
ncbi:MAG: Crp/Fnr family transcriptional regulator [Bariatricus sp.]